MTLAESLRAAALCLLTGSGCRHAETRAEVSCLPSDDTFHCTVHHVSGEHHAWVCWDVQVTCATGGPVLGHACRDVGPGEQAIVIIPIGQMRSPDGCEGVTGFSVAHMIVGEQP